MTRSSATTRRSALLARSALGGVVGAMALGAMPALAQVTQVGTITGTNVNSGGLPAIDNSVPGQVGVTLGGSRSIINWSDLNVEAGETLNFDFANRGWIVVNRVTGGVATLNGTLNANCSALCSGGAGTGGNVWMLSAGGVMIGGAAQINTGGFLASTGNLTDGDILDGDMNFAFTGAAAGSAVNVANGAQITTSGGSLALIAPVVTTAAGATLTATNGGDVVYGAAENYNVTFAPTGTDDLDLISFQVPSQTDGAGGAPGLTLNGTTNANQVFAAVVSKASVASSILLGGSITATAASGENGDIVLSAGGGFTNGVADTPLGFDASITQNTTSTLTADNVTLRASDNIAVDEINATGRVWLNSEWTSISQTGAITANVLRAEAGGDVILTNAGNDFNFLTYIEAQGVNGIDIVDADGFVINDYVFHFGGGTRTASLTALTGSISSTGSGVIQVGMLNVSAVGGSIDLGSAASNTTNLGTITAGAGDFAYRSLLDVNVAGVITASNVSLSSLAGQITESGGGAILASSLTASASNGISLSNANNDISAIAGLSNSGSGDVVYGQTDGFQITGAVTAVGQGMSLSSTNGSITQTASGIITAGLLNANAGADLILDQANIVGGIGNLMAGGGAGDDLVFNSTLGFAVSGTVGGDDITLTSGGSISQGASSRIVANFLTVDAAGGIDLPNGGFGTGNDIDALGLVTAGGAVSIGSISALDLTADIDTSGANLTLYSQLGITQSGGVLKVGALYAQSRADGITLNQANEVASLGHIFVESSGDFTFRNVGDVVVNGMVEVIGDDISLTSDTGSVVVNGVGMRAAALSVSAQTGINLNRSNSIGTVTALTTAAGDITFLNSGGFNIAGAVSADNVTLTSTAGAITQSSGIITADVLTASAAGGIDLDQVNAVTTLGALTAGATGDVTFTNSGDLELTGNIASGAGGVAAITSTTGAIDQISGAITADWIKLDAATTITQGSGATLSSTALSLTSGGNVSLAQANSFTSLYDLAVGGDLTLRNAGNIDMGPTLSGFYSAGGALTLTSDTGSIFTTGAGVITSRLTASAAGSITLDGAIASLGAVTAGGNILLNTYSTAMDLTGDVTGQTVSLYADSGVAQSGGKIDASRLNVITSGAISLTGANEIDVVGRLNTDPFLGGTGANVTLRNVGAIVLDYLVEAAGATASFTSDTGAITQTGFGAITANRLIASAAGGITLYDGTNNVATIGGLATVGGDIVYRDVDGFDIQGDITANAAITRGVMLVAGGTGAITQTSGVFDVGYFRGISGGSITLGGANQIRRLISTVISNGALSLNTTTGLSVDGTVSANAVSLISAAAITQATNAQIWTNTLNVSAVTGVNLTASGFGANNIGNLGTIANTTSGGITIANAYPSMNLTGNITAAGQAVSISNTMAGINQTGGIITAGALSLSAAGAISATRNNAFDSLGVVTAAGDVAITNIGQLMVTGSVNTGGGDLSLVSTTGQIEQTGGVVAADVLNLAAGGRIWVNNANAVNSLGVVTAGGHILFRNQANTIVGGDITATGFDVTLRSNTGSVTQTAGSDISSQYLQVIAQSGINLTNAGNNVAELAWVDNASGGVAFGQTNGFTVSYLRASSQAVSLTSLAGAITQNAGWSLTAGTLNASAAGTLTLNQSTNVDNLGVISTGGSFLFRDLNGFNLTGNVTAASQVVMVAQNGSINQTGGVITAADINAMATGDILLGSANVVGAISALSAGNDLLYRQVGDLAVPTISATGTVSLYSTTGDITQTGTITTDTLVLGAFDDITLGQNFISKLGQIDAGGDFDASNAAGLSSGALGLTGNITVGGAMTLVNPGAIFQTSSTGITASSLFIDTDGALGATGDNSISGNTRLSATGAVFNAVGDLTLQVNVTGFATITGADAVVFDGVGASTGDTLNVEAVNGISQGAAGLNFTKFGNLTNTTTGGISLTNDSWMTLNGAISALGQTVALNVVSGGIIQSSGSNIAANRLSVTSTQGALMGEMNQVDELGVINVGAHNFLFRTLGDLLIDGDLSSALNVNLTSAIGSIGQTAGSDITAGTLNVTAETGINLTNAGNDVGTLRTMINLGGSGGIAYAQTDGFQIDSVIRAWNQMVSLSSLAGGISETGTTFAQIEAGTLNVSAAGAITLHRDNDIDNLGVVSAVGGFTFNDVDGFNLTGNVGGGGAVVLDARNGSILQTGGVISASSIDAAASGNLALGSANVVGAVTALTAGGDILYRQVGNLSVPAITATGSLSLYSTTGSISQTGALNAATLNLGAVTGILLGNAGNDIGALGTVSNTTSGQINFLNGDDFDLTGAITAGGSQFVTLNALSGAITQQASGSITAQVLSLVAWSGATLGGDNDVDALGVILGGPSFVFNDIDDVDISGALNAQAADLTAGGAITQSAGNLNVGMLSLTAASVALDGANTITTLGGVDVTGNMSLSDVDGITLDGVQAVDGTLALTAGTFVTQQGGGLDVGRLEIDAGTAVSINLSGNAIGALGDVASTSGSIAIVNSNAGVALDIDGDVSAAATGQTVDINSLGSGVTMSAAGSIISGANTDVRGGGNIVLGDIDAGGVLTVVAAGGSVSSTAAPTIAATRLTGTATTGSFILTGANIDIDEIGYIEVGNTFSITGNTGPLLLSNNIIAQTVSLGTTGALTQIGGSLDATTGSFSAGGALTLGANNSVDTVSLNGASVSYASAGSFAANVVTATGAVSLTSTAGKITQTALTGKIVADSLAASAATGLEFFGGQNDIRVLAGLSSTGGGVTWRDSGGFEITGNISAAGQTVELVSDGTGADGTDVTQSGGVITANRLQGTSAGDLLFASANLVGQLGYLDAGGNIRFRGAASFTLQDNVNAGGGFILNADTGSIQQVGGVIVADAFAGTAAIGIGLSRANDVDFLGAVDAGTGDFNFRDLDSLAIAGLIAADNGVLLESGGNITQSSGSIVTGTLRLSVSGAAVVNGSGNDIDFLGESTGMNALAFADVDGFAISDRVFSSGAISLTAATGDIAEVAGGYLSANGLSVYASNGEIGLAGDNTIENIGDLIAGGDLTFHETDGFLTFGNIAGDAVRLTADSGAIAQVSGAISGDSLYASALTGLNLNAIGNDVDVITGLVNLTNGGISYHDADSVSITGAVTAVGQTVNFDVNGALTQTVTGVISAGRVQGAATGAFALADAANEIAQLGPISADSISLVTVDTGLTIVGALYATQGVDLKADDIITQTAAGTITGQTLRAQADGDITLAGANDVDSITLLYSDFGDITYADVDGFSLDGSSLGDLWTGGAFTLSAGGSGSITQSGAALRAGTLLVSAGGDVTLDEANRIDVLGDSSAGGSVFQVVNLGDLEIAGDIAVAHAMGAVDLTSQTGKVEQTSGEVDAYRVGGAAAGDFILTRFTNALGDITTTAGDIDITNAGDIFLFGTLKTDNTDSVTLTSTAGSIGHGIGRIETGTLNLDAAIGIALDGAQANDVELLGTVRTYSNFAFRDDDGVDLTGDIDVTMVGASVNLTSSTGAITQSGGVITAYGLNLQTATGADLASANMVSQLNLTNSGAGDVYVINGKTISVGTAINLGGLVEIGTTAGDIVVATGIEARTIRLISAADIDAAHLEATGDILVDATNGDAEVGFLVVGDDATVQAVNGSARVRRATLFPVSDNEGDGNNLTIAAGTGDAILGADDEASIGAANGLDRVSGVGGVFVSSLSGDAGVFLSSLNEKIDTLSANSATG
ncbi:MAG: filamentous hemagglutinin N-terminal domain-containing protein, partial [Pseudomonadota bacterium]